MNKLESSVSKLLCLVDIQKEYNTNGRPFFIPGIETSLAVAQRVLLQARQEGWLIIHVKHLQSGDIFNLNSCYSAFIEGFEPTDGELVVEKNMFSSFSNLQFVEFLEGYRSAQMYLIGYGSTMCCLSTLIEAHHRGFQFQFVCDASNAKPTSQFASEALHQSAIEILKSFCRVINSEELV